VNNLIKPTKEALDLVHEWLLINGIEKMTHSPAKDWVHVYIDVESAERLLDTEYYVFENKDDGSLVIRTPEWSLPKHLHEHIDTIQPTNVFTRSRAVATDWKQFDKPWTPPDYKPPTDAAIAQACSINGTTPLCFATLYQTLGYVQQVPGINQIAFNNFLGEVPITPDTEQFLSIYKPEAVPGASALTRVDIAGGPSHLGPVTADEAAYALDKEANLDFQTIVGMTYPMPVTAYSTGGVPPEIPDAAAGDPPGNEPYLTWANYVLSQPSLPQVISTSYGDDEQTVPEDYARRVCNSFAQLGARGISLLFSSGDGGVGDIAGDDVEECISNDGKNTTKFIPSFPVSCPYVTSVGATQGFEVWNFYFVLLSSPFLAFVSLIPSLFFYTIPPFSELTVYSSLRLLLTDLQIVLVLMEDCMGTMRLVADLASK
jgi:tripeptidyl-peptidase-1